MFLTRTPFLKLTIASILLFLGVIVFSLYAPSQWVSPNIYYIVPFFYLITLLSVLIHLRLEKTGSVHSKMFFLVSSGVKLMLYIALLILYGVFFRDDVIPFFISFLTIYLIYSYLDVRAAFWVLSK